jgi:peptidylprolyl isomerase/FKBP-type peptidyl-prolyl cis-trans isomerase FkpA
MISSQAMARTSPPFVIVMVLCALVAAAAGCSKKKGAGAKRTLEGGLVVQDLSVGTGSEAVTGSTVAVHYVGRFTDGNKFDSSQDRGQPLEFKLGAGAMIQGFDLGIPGMRVGGKRQLTIPAELAYGARGGGPIPPNTTLVFDVELVALK